MCTRPDRRQYPLQSSPVQPIDPRTKRGRARWPPSPREALYVTDRLVAVRISPRHTRRREATSNYHRDMAEPRRATERARHDTTYGAPLPPAYSDDDAYRSAVAR